MAVPEQTTCNVVTVAIVDDERESRETLQAMVVGWGYRVDAYSNACDFLEYADPQEVQCLIFDVRMPGMDGIELYHRIEEMGWYKPVLFITANANVAMAVEAIERGAAGFFEKPVNPEDLKAHLHTAIEAKLAAEHRQKKYEQVERRYKRLTSREREIMAYIVRGLLSKQIAAELQLSVRTVEVHRLRLMHKMEALTVADLVRDAVKYQLCNQLDTSVA